MIIPPIAIVGPSGTGKSYALRNLDPASTVIFCPERKALPFKTKFQHLVFPDPNSGNGYHNDSMSTITKAFESPKIKTVVIDSATKHFELLLKKSDEIHKGYDVYKWYNKQIYLFLELLKTVPDKYVFILAIDEIVEVLGSAGSKLYSMRRIKVGGKEWEGSVEKEFTIVLYTDFRLNDKGESQYRLRTNTDGVCSAKSPPGMFDQFIDNDAAIIIEKMNAYYGFEPNILV